MISLIIPVYNKAPYLKRCLDSVAKQINDSVQVIIINDGSTDGSTAICAQYREKYGWDLWCTQNRGVSAARNLGLEKATGEYVGFLDADDLLADNAINSMANEAKSGKNIIQFGQYRSRTYETLSHIPRRSEEGQYSFDFIPKYWVMVWNKIYKRSFLRKNRIEFKEGMQFGEDTLFNARCILANNGLYHSALNTVIHCWEDRNSLCRGGADYKRVEILDNELCKLEAEQTDPAKKMWLETAINEHRGSKFYKKHGFNKGLKGSFDVVYFVKDTPTNEELKYSLRSVEQNWRFRNVVFYGGCPKDLTPDKHYKLDQNEGSKWKNVRKMMAAAFNNDELTDNIWIFNDDFFVMKPGFDDMPPQYNGDIFAHSEIVKRRHGGRPMEWTNILDNLAMALFFTGKDTLNYEVHKPMLINRKKALEVLRKFPNTHGFRSLYGNYWNIGGVSKHDMKCLVMDYAVEKFQDWEFLSTQDDSFERGTAGLWLKDKFKNKSRFEI